MHTMQISLFGRLEVECQGRIVSGLEAHKVQELLCYLVIYKEHFHSREKLASHLWADKTTSQAKRNLRQVIYQLQSALPDSCDLLLVEPEWIGLNPAARYWVDVAVFEQQYLALQEVRGDELTDQQAAQLHQSVELYRGELLEGWYQDWCIYERERFQTMYLSILDRLLAHAEASYDYEHGLIYGLQILRYDRAHERTYQRLMRLYYQAGDRSRALKQYNACVAALADELDVAPSEATIALYQEICTDRLGPVLPVYCPCPATMDRHPGVVPKGREYLSDIQTTLQKLQKQIENYLRITSSTLPGGE